MTAADVPWIVALYAAPHARPFMQLPSEDEVRAVLGRPDLVERIVLDQAGERVAIWRAGLEETWLAEIRTLAVARPGIGAGSWALQRALAWAFGEQRVHKAYLYVTAANARARALYERHGLRLEGTHRDGFRAPDGTFEDLCHYGILAGEYAMTNQATAAAAGTLTIGGDLTVNRMGFGAMRVVGKGVWGMPPDPEAAKNVLRYAVANGVNFIDTADSYGPDTSEELIAGALAPYSAGLVIATKGGLTRPGPGEWDADGRPAHLREALEGSLRRLRLDCIDLYQFHRPDPKVPYAESIGAIAEMQRAGKIRHVGVSNVDLKQLAAARKIVTVVSVQNRYNFEDRSSEDVLDACARDGIAFLPWAPIGGPSPMKAQTLERLARDHNATPLQIALAWLLARSPVMLPIPGTGSIAHLDENLAAAALHLSAQEFRLLGDG
ncbi:MAG TPA: oxidoreductase [Candidatus Lustribacter sp.]|nr:oxidoreductase [Candidatus Lustribacter sp.]